MKHGTKVLNYNDETRDKLEEFMAKRTIGFEHFGPGLGAYWRGQGYDDGWEDVSMSDLVIFYQLLGDLLNNR